jgi:hypothetical protein
MSDTEKSAEEIFVFAIAVTEQVARIAENRGFCPAETTLVMAQALAMTIEKNGKTGYRKNIAADMAAVVAAYPPINDDQPMSEAIH